MQTVGVRLWNGRYVSSLSAVRNDAGELPECSLSEQTQPRTNDYFESLRGFEGDEIHVTTSGSDRNCRHDGDSH